jgi:hypothetical protein
MLGNPPVLLMRPEEPLTILPYTFQIGGLVITKTRNHMTESYQSLAHSKWKYNYHIVFIPKRRCKMWYGKIQKHLDVKFHNLVRQGRRQYNRRLSNTRPWH